MLSDLQHFQLGNHNVLQICSGWDRRSNTGGELGTKGKAAWVPVIIIRWKDTVWFRVWEGSGHWTCVREGRACGFSGWVWRRTDISCLCLSRLSYSWWNAKCKSNDVSNYILVYPHRRRSFWEFDESVPFWHEETCTSHFKWKRVWRGKKWSVLTSCLWSCYKLSVSF